MVGVGRVLGMVGFILLGSLPLTLFVWDWEFSWVAWVKSSLGLVLVAFWLITNFKRLQQRFVGRSIFYGSFNGLFVIMTLTAVVLVNTLAYEYPLRIDLTAEKIFSLSEQSKKTLASLSEDIEVIAFYGPRHRAYRALNDTMERYRQESRHFGFRLVDTEVEPLLAEQYKIRSGGPRILMRYRDREERVRLDEDNPEESITRALVKVTSPEEENRICFLVGHGEIALQGPEPLGRISLLVRDLESEGYVIETVSLLEARQVPESCQLLVVSGPRGDLIADESKSIRSYLENHGKLLVFVGSGDTSSLNPLMKEFGVGIGDNLVISPRGRVPVEVVSDYSLYPSSHPVFSQFFESGLSQAIFPWSRSVEKNFPVPPGFQVVELVKSTLGVWAEYELSSGGSLPSFDPGKDIPGPVSLAVVVANPMARLAVFGSSLMVTDGWYSQIQFNRDLILNTIAWLSQEEQKITIRPRFRAASLLRLDKSHLQFITFFSMDILPILILIVGITVWQLRRWSS